MSESHRAVIVLEGRWRTWSYLGVLSLPTLLNVIVFACTRSLPITFYHLLPSPQLHQSVISIFTLCLFSSLTSLHSIGSLLSVLLPPLFFNLSHLPVLDGIPAASVYILTFVRRAFGRRMSLLYCSVISWTTFITKIWGCGILSSIWIVRNVASGGGADDDDYVMPDFFVDYIMNFAFVCRCFSRCLHF